MTDQTRRRRPPAASSPATADPRIVQLVNRFAAGGPYLVSLPFTEAITEALVIVLGEVPRERVHEFIGRAAVQLVHEWVADDDRAEGAAIDPDEA